MGNLTTKPDSKLIILLVKGRAVSAYCAADREITSTILHTDDLSHDFTGLSEAVVNIPAWAGAAKS